MALAVVFQIGSLGDTVVSVPTLLSLRELLPECSEYVLISGDQGKRKVQAGHIFDMAWPAKAKLTYLTKGSAWARLLSMLKVFARLQYYRPRYAVYLLPSDRTAPQVKRDKLFFRAAGVSELIGFRALSQEERHMDDDLSRAGTESYLRFRRIWNERADEKFEAYCQQPLLRPSESAVSSALSWLAAHRHYPERQLIAICPFSNAGARDMNSATVAALTRRLESELAIEVVLLGGIKDTEAIEAIRVEAGAGLNGCGAFPPDQSAALFRLCALAVCVDSGPLHLAGAVGLPTVSAYAVINRPFHRWMPLGPDHTMLFQKVSCRGCEAITNCPVAGHPCMTDTTADQLFATICAKLTRTLIPAGVLNGTRLLEWPASRQGVPTNGMPANGISELMA